MNNHFLNGSFSIGPPSKDAQIVNGLVNAIKVMYDQNQCFIVQELNLPPYKNPIWDERIRANVLFFGQRLTYMQAINFTLAKEVSLAAQKELTDLNDRKNLILNDENNHYEDRSLAYDFEEFKILFKYTNMDTAKAILKRYRTLMCRLNTGDYFYQSGEEIYTKFDFCDKKCTISFIATVWAERMARNVISVERFQKLIA